VKRFGYRWTIVALLFVATTIRMAVLDVAVEAAAHPAWSCSSGPWDAFSMRNSS